MDLDIIRAFSLLAKHGNMTRVADIVGLTPSTVSRQMRILEDYLKVKLFNAFPSGVILTEAGETFATEADHILEAFHKSTTCVRSINEAEGGPLRILGSNFGMYWFSIYLEEFKTRHPEIDITLTIDDYKAILYPSELSGTCVGLTSIEPPEQSTLIWTRLGSYHIYPYASSEYLERFGIPKSLQDLDHHQLIGYCWGAGYSYLSHHQSNALLYIGREESDPREAFVRTDDGVVCRDLIERGNGIGLISRYLAYKRPVVELLQGVYKPHFSYTTNVYFVVPSHLRENRRVQKLREFITEIIARDNLLT